MAIPVALVVVLGIVGGIGWTQIRGVGGQKELASSTSMESRLLFWKAALGGIRERPVFGWGGGNFDYYWPLFLSPSEQEQILRLELGVYKIVSYISAPGTVPLWVVENQKGEHYTQPIVLSPGVPPGPAGPAAVPFLLSSSQGFLCRYQQGSLGCGGYFPHRVVWGSSATILVVNLSEQWEMQGC